jgi:hypothetical protein
MKTCEHLEPLEGALADADIALKKITSPYGDDWRWFGCDCTFDERALRKRIALAKSVHYEEYDGRVAGSDATFGCKACKCAVMGLHPAYAPKKTRKLR